MANAQKTPRAPGFNHTSIPKPKPSSHNPKSKTLNPPNLYLCLLKTVFIYRLTHLCFELTLVVLKPFAQASSAVLAHASLYFCALQFVVLSYSFCFPHPPTLGGLGLFVPTLSFYTLGALPPLLEKGCRVPCVLIAVGVSGLGINANPPLLRDCKNYKCKKLLRSDLRRCFANGTEPPCCLAHSWGFPTISNNF